MPAPDRKCGRYLCLRDLRTTLHGHFLHDREINFDELFVVRDHINLVELVALGFANAFICHAAALVRQAGRTPRGCVD